MRGELWEQEFNGAPQPKEVMSRRKRRATKGGLVRKFYEKGERIMPKIDTEVREGADDVTEGVPYEITNVEDIITDVQNLSGIRVTVLSQKAEEGNVVLWKRKITGVGSKLGVFITELGNNTDGWLHKWVIFRTWQPRNRVLEVIEAPKSRKTKATTGKGVAKAIKSAT